jgi:hypothetical protein
MLRRFTGRMGERGDRLDLDESREWFGGQDVLDLGDLTATRSPSAVERQVHLGPVGRQARDGLLDPAGRIR